ncbi:MAG: TIGR03790 family protein, partial [Desulfobacterales bacterium]
SFDSELALVLEENYPISGWIPNPYFIGLKNKKKLIKKDNVLIISRLDGPSVPIVKRIIQDSVNAEKNGLNGTAYFDARWAKSNKQKLSGYAFYDNSIHLAADRIRESNLLSVVLNKSKELFQPGEATDASLYCGWYSLANYVDAFIWHPGAVGYHIASSECVTLKKRNSRVWCKMMLEKGIAATIGPVGEPYVEAFPIPEVFFGLLIDGYLTLAECYQVSLPFLSWKMVLIGDPLYRPFKNLRGKN